MGKEKLGEIVVVWTCHPREGRAIGVAGTSHRTGTAGCGVAWHRAVLCWVQQAGLPGTLGASIASAGLRAGNSCRSVHLHPFPANRALYDPFSPDCTAGFSSSCGSATWVCCCSCRACCAHAGPPAYQPPPSSAPSPPPCCPLLLRTLCPLCRLPLAAHPAGSSLRGIQ